MKTLIWTTLLIISCSLSSFLTFAIQETKWQERAIIHKFAKYNELLKFEWKEVPEVVAEFIVERRYEEAEKSVPKSSLKGVY